jgi:hypothetical protein
MIMKTKGRRESLGSGKNHLMFIEDGLEVVCGTKGVLMACMAWSWEIIP